MCLFDREIDTRGVEKKNEFHSGTYSARYGLPLSQKNKLVSKKKNKILKKIGQGCRARAGWGAIHLDLKGQMIQIWLMATSVVAAGLAQQLLPIYVVFHLCKRVFTHRYAAAKLCA